jgi:aminomethyltransferase
LEKIAREITLKRTPFYDIHVSLGAKLVPFGGYEMPLQYSSIIAEHLAVRNSVGVFDISHMGEVEVTGSDALAFLQRITTNDVSKLFPGRVHYSAMCYENGGIVDDVVVYQRAPNNYLLVVNASNQKKDYDWMIEHKEGDVTIENKSDYYAMLALQGPSSLATLEKLTNENLSAISYYHFISGTIAGVPMLISRTGYTGEIGFELYFPSDPALASKVWNAIFEAGKEFNIQPVGLGARDSLRLEMGYCLYGNDIDETTNPLEAGLEWITKFNKGDFIGKNTLLEIKQQGVRRKLVGFLSQDKRIPRHGYQIKQDGVVVGYVTSGGYSPILQKGIGLGYVSVDALQKSAQLMLDVRGEQSPINLTQVPFLKK